MKIQFILLFAFLAVSFRSSSAAFECYACAWYGLGSTHSYGGPCEVPIFGKTNANTSGFSCSFCTVIYTNYGEEYLKRECAWGTHYFPGCGAYEGFVSCSCSNADLCNNVSRDYLHKMSEESLKNTSTRTTPLPTTPLPTHPPPIEITTETDTASINSALNLSLFILIVGFSALANKMA